MRQKQTIFCSPLFKIMKKYRKISRKYLSLPLVPGEVQIFRIKNEGGGVGGREKAKFLLQKIPKLIRVI